MPYVFEMFRQVPGTGGGGVGLGLHIVRRFVDALGGTVAVTSTVGAGTSFVVTLPPAALRPEIFVGSAATDVAAAATRERAAG
jgi:signal transduction histidine kinase